MPIYAYRCSACGHAQDVLQKLSDPVLTVCPACGASSFAKQLTAAGFHLKGSGWYATDFRGGNPAASKDKDAGEGEGSVDGGKESADKSVDKPAAEKPTDQSTHKATDKTADKTAAKPAAKPAAAASSGDATQ